ncbi:ABC transporter substrate-binding protein [Leifsonia sp. Leaf264]|nr:ABC transporter substrate-binding protein [Leifsonia sp. Leaf264]
MLAAVAVSTLALSACGSGGGSSAAPTKFTYLHVTEDPATPAIIKELAGNECTTEDKALPYDDQSIAQAQLDQKVQLLAGQDALPTMFSAGGAPTVTQALDEAGQLVDVAAELDKLGVSDDLLPAARSTIENLYGGNVNALPFQFNIEGFWYNKQIFADNGLEVPTTWDELTNAAKVLNDAGVQPFATGASGQGWPVTRLISGYLFRELGPDAMADIRDGKTKLTDPEYVKAAQAIADLGTAGYLGKAPEAVDYNTIISDFLTGKAGIMYMGSWALPNFADETANKIGSENIGFFAYPEVEGGKGSIDQLPANIGVPTALSQKSYDKNVGAWVKCIAENFGSAALKESGQISGFKVNTPVETDDLTTLVQQKIEETSQSVVWFETYFSSKASTTSWNNIASLVDGKITAEEFMKLVQADL